MREYARAMVVAVLVGGSTLALAARQDDPAAALRNAEAAVHASDRALRQTIKDDPKRFTPDFEREHTEALKQALARYMIAFKAARPNARARDVRAALQRIYTPWPEPHRLNTPHLATGRIGDRNYVIVSWLLFRGGMGVPRTSGFIQAFTDTGTSLQPIADAGREFDGHGLLVRELKSAQPNQIWLLAHGQRFGDTGARNNVVIYAFDGKQFSVLWSRTDLPGLEVETVADVIRLRYLRPGGTAPPGARADSEVITEEYRLTARGPELVRGAPK